MRKYVWLRLGGAMMLAAFALLAGYTAPASAQDAPSASRVVLPGKGQPGSPFNLASSGQYLLNHNAWVCGLAQIGNVCSSAVGSSVGGGGFWPQGTANQYIFNSGLQVGALIGPDGGDLLLPRLGSGRFDDDAFLGDGGRWLRLPRHDMYARLYLRVRSPDRSR